VTNLAIALPAGALLEGACDLLREAGVAQVDARDFDRRLRAATPQPVLVKVRPTDVPVYVEMGACDGGIVGEDVLWETQRELYKLLDLRFGRCRLVLAAPAGSALARGDWEGRLRVATKYPRSAQRFFARLGRQAELIRLHGSVELAPAMGLADAVLDLTATGATLRANHLVEVAEVGTSTARLVVNQAALKTRTGAISALAVALRRAVEARASSAGAA
jgi:ATP phosphoribosyltransferase